MLASACSHLTPIQSCVISCSCHLVSFHLISSTNARPEHRTSGATAGAPGRRDSVILSRKIFIILSLYFLFIEERDKYTVRMYVCWLKFTIFDSSCSATLPGSSARVTLCVVYHTLAVISCEPDVLARTSSVVPGSPLSILPPSSLVTTFALPTVMPTPASASVSLHSSMTLFTAGRAPLYLLTTASPSLGTSIGTSAGPSSSGLSLEGTPSPTTLGTTSFPSPTAAFSIVPLRSCCRSFDYFPSHFVQSPRSTSPPPVLVHPFSSPCRPPPSPPSGVATLTIALPAPEPPAPPPHFFFSFAQCFQPPQKAPRLPSYQPVQLFPL